VERRWSDDELITATRNSTSVRQIIFKLGLKPTGGNYDQIGRHTKRLGIQTNHLKGRAWNKGMKGFVSSKKIPMEKILIKNSEYQSYKLRDRLISEGYRKCECEECGWRKKSLDGKTPVELHHKNGRKKDNRLNNLQILCPNCHSLKEDHRGKNIR